MAVFIAAALVLALAAAGAILVGTRPQRGQVPVSRAGINAAVLRQQLAELEAERTRGLLDEREFGRAREELQQRLLAEIDAAPAAAKVPRAPRLALLVYAMVLPLAAAGLYLQLGSPGLLDAVPADFPAAAGAGAGDEAALLAQLESHLAASPRDARAWVMLARARMQQDRFEAASFAYARAVDASARVARDPLIWCEYADALAMAAGGRLAGTPRELIDKALALDAAHPRALEMAGSAAYEAGDYRGAMRYWQQLRALLPAESAERAELDAAIFRAEQRARFGLPAS